MTTKLPKIETELASLEPIKKQIERINMETQIIKEKTLSLKMESLVDLNKELLEALSLTMATLCRLAKSQAQMDSIQGTLSVAKNAIAKAEKRNA